MRRGLRAPRQPCSRAAAQPPSALEKCRHIDHAQLDPEQCARKVEGLSNYFVHQRSIYKAASILKTTLPACLISSKPVAWLLRPVDEWMKGIAFAHDSWFTAHRGQHPKEATTRFHSVVRPCPANLTPEAYARARYDHFHGPHTKGPTWQAPTSNEPAPAGILRAPIAWKHNAQDKLLTEHSSDFFSTSIIAWKRWATSAVGSCYVHDWTRMEAMHRAYVDHLAATGEWIWTAPLWNQLQVAWNTTSIWGALHIRGRRPGFSWPLVNTFRLAHSLEKPPIPVFEFVQSNECFDPREVVRRAAEQRPFPPGAGIVAVKDSQELRRFCSEYFDTAHNSGIKTPN